MSTQIVLRDGLSLATLPVATVRTVIDQAVILRLLSDMRDQWRQATGGKMERVTVNMSMLFDDLENLVNGEKPVNQLPESDQLYQEVKARIGGMYFTPQEEEFIYSTCDNWNSWTEQAAWLMAAPREEIQAWLDANSR